MKGHLSCCLVVFVSLAVLGGGVVAAEKNYEQRIKHLERLFENQNSLEVLRQMQNLQREVSGLRGELELLSHGLGEARRQQKDIYIDLDQRMLDLDKRLNSGVPMRVGVDMSAADGDAVEQAALNEQEGYQAALAVLKDARYSAAIEAFQLYLVNYPLSVYAVNAQYWMAEAFYVLKSYDAAIEQFNKVIDVYPGSRKVADAHLKVGFSYYEMKRWRDARQSLELIISRFSGSTAARLAKHRLQKMKQEGRG